MRVPRAWLVAAAALAGACGDAHKPPPARVINACLAEIARAQDDGDGATVASLACPDLYQHPRCRAAWKALAAGGDVDRAMANVERECRIACEVLAGGAPPRACVSKDDPFGTNRAIGRVAAIDQAVLRLQGIPGETADKLAQRIVLMRAEGADGPKVRAGAFPAKPFAAGDATLAVTVNADELWIDGEEVVDDDQVDAIVAAVRQARDRSGAARAVITADEDAPYQRIVTVMDALKTAGIGEIALSTAPTTP